MTDDQVRALIVKRARPFICKSGRGSGKGRGIRPWAEFHGLPNGHVSEFMSGKREATAPLLAALGLEYRIVMKRRFSGSGVPTTWGMMPPG